MLPSKCRKKIIHQVKKCVGWINMYILRIHNLFQETLARKVLEQRKDFSIH